MGRSQHLGCEGCQGAGPGRAPVSTPDPSFLPSLLSPSDSTSRRDFPSCSPRSGCSVSCLRLVVEPRQLLFVRGSLRRCSLHVVSWLLAAFPSMLAASQGSSKDFPALERELLLPFRELWFNATSGTALVNDFLVFSCWLSHPLSPLGTPAQDDGPQRDPGDIGSVCPRGVFNGSGAIRMANPQPHPWQHPPQWHSGELCPCPAALRDPHSQDGSLWGSQGTGGTHVAVGGSLFPSAQHWLWCKRSFPGVCSLFASQPRVKRGCLPLELFWCLRINIGVCVTAGGTV